MITNMDVDPSPDTQINPSSQPLLTPSSESPQAKQLNSTTKPEDTEINGQTYDEQPEIETGYKAGAFSTASRLKLLEQQWVLPEHPYWITNTLPADLELVAGFFERVCEQILREYSNKLYKYQSLYAQKIYLSKLFSQLMVKPT